MVQNAPVTMNKIMTIGFIFVMMANLSWAQMNTTDPANAIVFGIKDKIHSAILSENRVLNIYLPSGYYKDDTAKYPVIYLLDGGVDEDFFHIAGLVYFNTFPWVGRMPESIVVGIANTDRKRDFTFPTSIKSDKEKYPTTGGSAKFISFIGKELQPYIQTHYRASGANMLIGESLGGLLATEILSRKPALFSKYVIVSPSLWWDNRYLLKQKMAITTTYPSRNTGIYIGVGKEGLTPGAYPRTMKADASKLAEKIKHADNKHIHLYFDYLPHEDHATIMHQAVYDAFNKLYSMHVVK